MRDNGLWGKVEWTDLGKQTLSDKQFKYISPEFYRDYEDPQTHQIYRNVLIAAALTKSPYFKELEAVVFSEQKLRNQFNDNNKIMNLAELLAKDITTLSDEEKAFIKAHAAELTDEQKVSHTAIIDVEDDNTAETPEEKEAREAKEKTDKEAADKAAADAAAAAGGDDKGGDTTTAPVNASEKVMISAGELAALRSKANEGAAAFAELKKNKINGAVASLLFSDSNRAGKFLPKSKDNLRAFAESLNDTQLVAFSALVAQLPTNQVFNEIGTGKAADGTAQAEVEAKIEAKMKSNDKMSYSDALKEVMSENKGLEERYDSELPSARKVNA